MGHSVLPKSTNEVRIRENLDVFDWSIPEDLFVKFSEIEQVSYLSFFHGWFIVVSDQNMWVLGLGQIIYFLFYAFQERLIRGSGFVHETFGAYRTIEELWDGEI